MTQTDQDFLQHDAGSAPETNSSYPAHVNQDDSDSNSSDQGNSDDDALDKFEDFFQNLRIRMRSSKNERNTFRDRNQALEDEIVELRAKNAELEESSARLRAQLDQAAVRLSETEHNSAL